MKQLSTDPPTRSISPVSTTPENHDQFIEVIKKEQEAGWCSNINTYTKYQHHCARMGSIVEPITST